MNDSSHSEYAFVLVIFTLGNEENAYTFNIIEHHYQRTCKGRFFSLVLRRECEGMECDFLLLPPINFMFKAPDCLSLSRERERKSWRELLGKWKPQKLSPTLFSIIIILFAFASLWLAFFPFRAIHKKKEWRRKKKFNLCEEGKILLSKWII